MNKPINIQSFICEISKCPDIQRLKAENEEKEHQINMILEEKIYLNKIIDRLLENAGFSKDIASAEDFETVYEKLQYKNNKFEEYQQALEEVREIVDKACKKCKNDEFNEDYCIGSDFCALAEINEVLKDE